MSDDGDWFAPKRFGIGGVPIRWQGWALILGFVAALGGLIFAFRSHPLQLIAAVIPLAFAFVVIATRKTRGGLRWRWGEEE